MKNLRGRRWLVVLAFVVVVLFTGFFATRTIRRAVYWHYHQDETIRPWMTIGYVAHSYNVPPWVLQRALGLPPGRDRRPIREIARAQNRSVEEVIQGLKEKDSNTHILITGRDAHPEIIALADLVTEMREIKHPYNTQKIKAQPGIEY